MIDDDTRHPRIVERAQHQEFADTAPTPVSNAAPPPPLSQWRADVLTLTARLLFVLGLFMLIPSMSIALSLQEFWRLLVDVPFLILLGGTAFVPRLGFALRATLLLGLLYGVSVFWLMLSGLVGSGRLYFVLLMVLAALLLNLRGTLLVWLLASLSIAMIFWGFATATLPLPLAIVERMFTPATLMTHWLAAVLVSGVIVAAIVLTINRLQHSFQAAEEARVALQRLNDQLEQRVAERTAELMQANEQLQAEITERKQAEEAYRTLVDNSLQALVIFQDGRNMFANPAAAHITGYTQEELLAMSPQAANQVVYPDDRVLLAERARQRQQGQDVPPRYEFRLIRKDGSVRWVEAFAVQTQYQGRPAAHMAYIDITERKHVEETLYFHAQLLDSIGQAVIATTLDGTITYWNRAAEHLYGWAKHEVIGQSVLSMTLAQPVYAQPGEIIERIGQGRSWEGEFLARHRAGSTFPAWVTDVPFVDTTGTIIGVIGVSMDITERKQAEQALRASEARFRSLVDHIPNGAVFLVDHDLRFLVARGQGLTEVGRQPVMLEGKTLASCLPADSYAIMEPIYRAALIGTAPPELEQRFGNRIYRLNPVSMTNEQGEIVAAMLLSQDITERKQAAEALRTSEQRLQAIFDNAAVGIGLTDNAGQSIIANARGAHQLGYTPEELAQRTNLELTHPDDRAETVECMQQLVRGDIQGYRIEKRYFRKDGSIFWADLSVSAIYDDDGQIAYILGIVVDITERKQLEQQLHQANVLLQEQAIRDPLTGLYNRRYLDETLPRELHRAVRHNQSLGIIMVDVDHFKRINDTYGHAAGDTLLQAVGAFLQHNTRSEDIVCRYGGEEFTLVLPGASHEDACHRAEELRAGIQSLVAAHQGQTLDTVTASLGIALFPVHGTTAAALVRTADQALYQAKHSGRNRVVMAATDNVPAC
jgi:diguanylate cyclase (GGDEF)-like protein/PAS domain S-box-containing protein